MGQWLLFDLIAEYGKGNSAFEAHLDDIERALDGAKGDWSIRTIISGYKAVVVVDNPVDAVIVRMLMNETSTYKGLLRRPREWDKTRQHKWCRSNRRKDSRWIDNSFILGPTKRDHASIVAYNLPAKLDQLKERLGKESRDFWMVHVQDASERAKVAVLNSTDIDIIRDIFPDAKKSTSKY